MDGTNIHHVMAFDWVNGSVILDVTDKLLVFLHLLFEHVEYLDLYWVDSSKYVPVNVLVTWWGGNGSLVDPSVFEVSEIHDLTVGNQVNNWFSILVPLHVLKESLESGILSHRDGFVEILNGEEETDSGILNLLGVVPVLGQMNGMHLEIKILTVNCVLRRCMEMELNT